MLVIILDNLGFIITISTTLGRTLGAFSLTFSGLISKDYINTIIFSFCTIFFLFLIVLTYIFYGELRVKAIARIIKMKNNNRQNANDF